MSLILKENETMQDLVERQIAAAEQMRDIAPVAWWYENLHENGRIKDIHFSPRMREMLGYTSVEEFPDELNTLMTFSHPDDVHIMLDDAILAGTGKIPKYDVRYRLRTASGDYRWCNATGQLVKDHTGKTIGMYGAFIDITTEMELKKAQQEQREEAAAHKAVAENNLRMLALDQNFTMLYEVDLETGAYEQYIKGHLLTEESTNSMQRSSDFFADLLTNVERVIHPDDREGLVRVLNRENIREALEKENHFDWYYRLLTGKDIIWAKMRFVYKDGSKRAIVVGIFDAQKEMASRHEQEKKQQELLDSVLGDDGVFLVDCREDTRRTVHARMSGAARYSDAEKYSAAFARYVETCVAEADRELMRRYVSPAYMMECLKIEKAFSVQYRDIADGAEIYVEMRITRFSDHEVLQSFAERDREILEKKMFDLLLDEYDALYMADLDRGRLRAARSSRVSNVGAFKGEKDYTEMILQFAETVAPQYKEEWIDFSDPAYMKRYLAKEDHREFVYELPGSNRTMRRFSMDVFERRDGVASTVLFSFMGIDDARAQTLRLTAQLALQQAELARRSAILDYFIGSYTTAYYADLHTGDVTVLQAGTVYARQLESRELHFDTLVSGYINDLVDPEERETVRALLDRGYIRERLASEESFTFTYRDISVNDPGIYRATVIRGEDEDHIGVGFKNITEEVRHEQEQQNRLRESDRIISALAADFICVNLVELREDKQEDTTVGYRTSALLTRLIPGWEKEKSFTKKLSMLCRQLVFIQDREAFLAQTRREKVLSALTEAELYHVNTRLMIEDTLCYYQIQFSAIRENGRITGIVAGIHSVDAQMRRELEDQKKLQELLKESEENNARLAEQSAFTTYFLEPYMSAYYIGFEDLSCRIYKRTAELQKDYPIVTNYLDSLNEYIDREVHPDDRAEFRQMILPETMKKLLAEQSEFTYMFRTVAGNGERHVRMRVIRGADRDHAAFGFMDITEELREQQKHLLGAVALSPDVLNKANIGLWAFELDEGKPPRMYGDDTMIKLVGLDHQVPPEEMYHAWYDHIDNNSYGLVTDAVARMSAGEHAEVQYPWHHPNGRTLIVRCGGVRNPEYKTGIRIEGTHQDVTATIRFDEEENERLRKAEIQLQHELLRAEVLNYMVDHDDDPIELLKNFAERIRVLIDCDQVIYRDLEETRIMVNSPAIEDTWHVPMEYCLQCQHLDAHHPMYAGGYTEMDNCQEGWQGIPVYEKCPIKSSLTRLVYCDGEIAGYLAIHYVQKYHHFTDIERATLEEFTRILSMSLSRYEANRRARELEGVRRRMNMIYSLSDEYDPVMVVDPESGEYDWFESRASEVADLTAMSVHGKDFYKDIGVDTVSIIHEEDKARFRSVYNKENLMRIVETGIMQETENRWKVGPDGTYLWKYNKLVRMVDEDGRVYVVVGVIDTTEAKEKEAAVRAQRKQLEEQQALSDGLAREYHTVWLVEGTGEHKLHLFRSTGRKTVQRAVQRGLDEPTYDSTMVKYVMDSVHEDDRERVLEASRFATVVRETPEIGTYVVSYKRYCDDEGHIDYHQMCFAKAVAEDGTVNYILAFRDADKMIREQLSQQQQLEEALAMAQSANRAKTTFLNNMSHDIRTPMNAIIGYTGLAASHIDHKEQVQDYLSKISQSSDHLLSLINDVLDMSRIESGKMNLDEKEENLSDIIHTLRDIVQADIHSKQLDFFVDAVDVNDEDIICDKLRLNQVLLNILSNSIKYTAAGGTVTMRVTEKTVKTNGYASYEFRVKDNGMGMDREFLKTIFDPFTRVRSSTVSGIQGTGLGMAITKNIIDMMGGRIEIESEIGKGTEVTITFEFKLQSAPKAPEQIPELKGVRALVADDDSNTCLSICGMVKDIGMRYEWCTSGKEAVIRSEAAYHEGDSFKVYIIDWIMPDMNGIETTRRIRKVIGDETPIIILTAYDWSDIEEEAREAGVTAFVSKPMFPSDLHRVLNSCLGREPQPVIEKPETFNFAGRKILLVEDNQMNREIATEILEESGFVIDTAEDGSIAVEKMRAAKPGTYDLVLMDVQMPIMDGYEATRQIRALGTEISRIPILAMTANAFEEDRKLALEAGMNEHISKPIDVKLLTETLARFL